MSNSSDFQRFAFTVEYNGLLFNGWQSQPQEKSKKTIQDTIENAFRIILQDDAFKIYGSGRTDAGVHASGQVFHADLPQKVDSLTIEKKLNGLLSNESVAILDVRKVSNEFHSRYSATSREYQYTINKKRSALTSHIECFFPYEFTLNELSYFASIIEKQSDFTSFCKYEDKNETKICKIRYARWTQVGTRYFFNIKSNRFLYGMVRALVGTQLYFIKEKIDPEQFENIFHEKDRIKAGFSAKSNGLNLIKVDYPSHLFLVD